MKPVMNRRTFLQGSSVAALCSLVPHEVYGAQKGLPQGATLQSSTTSSSSTYSAAPSFNGGRTQVNLNFLQTGGDYPFINCMKTAQSWTLMDNSGSPEPTSLDANGYPISITRGGVYTVFFVPSQASRPGNYVITWNGNGTIFCGMSNTAVSGSKTSTSGSGRYVFSTRDSRFVIGISAIGSTPITNLQVFHANDEMALNSGQVFSAKFKQRLLEAKFGVVRFLNWQVGNTTNVTTWATRKPISYVFYSGSEFRASIYAGLTSNVGSAYSAQLAGFRLADKATVMVKFNVSNSGLSTLNVSGTGDIRILNEYSNPLSSGSNSYAVGGTWQSFATLVYDATLNAWIKQGGDVARGSLGISNGCPPELMVRLCAEIGAHPYFVTPPLAIDPATDYMPSLAAYCRDNGPSWMVPRFEGPNELWNTASGFYQTGYANAKATAYGWGADCHNWYGKAMSVLGQAISTVYNGDRTKYQVLCGVQTATGTSASGTGASDARLASPKYLAQSSAPQSPYTKTPASRWVTHVCCAQYFTPSEYGTAQETTDATAYVAAAGNPDLQLQIATAYANTANSGTGAFTLYKAASYYANWKAWAKKFGVQKMCGYEGGYSPDYTGGGRTAVDILRAASKQVASVNGFTTQNYNNFVGLTDATFVAEFPSCFQLSGSAPSNNAWSVLEDVYQTTIPPQWAAIVSFNH
ncbi:hypothetical protein [Bradyrhizobium sp. CCBAU 11434]|uniref:hypothetical protein n=1 Tax=Bradyrhizobium sp. CCBAU 11434 TaxID=1630885 RepID=UPI002305B6AD|nr:hypothetical protein [Bradyrhizobium sp. CCBAU 11434]